MNVERERTQSYLLYMCIHRYIQRDLICGMTYSFICIFVVHAFICVPWWSMYTFMYMVSAMMVHLCIHIHGKMHFSSHSCVLQTSIIRAALLFFPHTYICVYRETSYKSEIMTYYTQTHSYVQKKWNLWHDTFIYLYFRDACIHICGMIIYMYFIFDTLMHMCQVTQIRT